MLHNVPTPSSDGSITSKYMMDRENNLLTLHFFFLIVLNPTFDVRYVYEYWWLFHKNNYSKSSNIFDKIWTNFVISLLPEKVPNKIMRTTRSNRRSKETQYDHAMRHKQLNMNIQIFSNPEICLNPISYTNMSEDVLLQDSMMSTKF